jgi:DNA-binding PadR family transcriptional regulator
MRRLIAALGSALGFSARRTSRARRGAREKPNQKPKAAKNRRTPKQIPKNDARLLQYLAVLGMIAGMKLTKDLVAASAVPLVLSILEEGESYGYAIMQRVRALSDGEIAWTDGMLYPVLHRLEEQGLIVSRWRESEAGRQRKYYALKLAGRRALREQKEQWLLVQGILDKLWGVQHVRAGTVY